MANPSEALNAYAITLTGSSIVVGTLFESGQIVQSPNTSPIIYGGETVILPDQTGQTNIYVGTATNSSGTAIGFIVHDTTTGNYFLFATTTLARNTALTLHTSSGVGDANADNWNLSSGTATAHCFMAGTAVLTPDGEKLVETLAAGDLVSLADGGAAPIFWLGRQTIVTLFADRLRVAPVRIKAGALAANLPARDLLISPCHAILVDGILVQAGALVNGISIIRETALPTSFIYYHVEVAAHALILAEGVAAETFVDNVDRMAFDNWEEHEALIGATAMTELALPRAKASRQVPPATRARLTARGAALYGSLVAAAA